MQKYLETIDEIRIPYVQNFYLKDFSLSIYEAIVNLLEDLLSEFTWIFTQLRTFCILLITLRTNLSDYGRFLTVSTKHK